MNEIETQETQKAPTVFDPSEVYLNSAAFNMTFKIARVFASSTMVPDIFKNNEGNCLIALNLANRLKAEPLMIMQKLYIVHGKPAMEAQLQHSLLESNGRFGPLNFHFEGKEGSDDWSCYATAVRREDGEKVKGPTVSIAMAKAEGWYGKKGSKWQTLPELMLTYRATSFFISAHDPACRMGLITREEAEDIKAVDVKVKPEPKTDPDLVAFDVIQVDIEEANSVEKLKSVKKSDQWKELRFYKNAAEQLYLKKLNKLKSEPIDVEPVQETEEPAEEPKEEPQPASFSAGDMLEGDGQGKMFDEPSDPTRFRD